MIDSPRTAVDEPSEMTDTALMNELMELWEIQIKGQSFGPHKRDRFVALLGDMFSRDGFLGVRSSVSGGNRK